MKNLPSEVIRLMQAAVDAKDALRRLAVSVDAPGDDPGRQAEVLQKARAVCLSHADSEAR